MQRGMQGQPLECVHRVIVSTNVAETSVTGEGPRGSEVAVCRGGCRGSHWSVCTGSSCQPTWQRHPPNLPLPHFLHSVEGVVYVVDTGVVKQKHYQPATGMDRCEYLVWGDV